jgi:predicted nucleic acid-binding protein
MKETDAGILIDTDVAIDYLRGREYARQFLHTLWDQEKAHLSILSVYELLAGMRRGEEEATRSFIEVCYVENLDFGIVARAGTFYRKYRRRGITLMLLDCLIMATAAVRGLKLATRNIKHYPEKHMLLWKEPSEIPG